MISNKHQCIFVHIPRTGGSSIETVLWPRKEEKDLWQGFTSRFNNEYQTDGLQHLYARNIRKAVGDRFDRYFKFTIVRNPWDKAVSSYAHAKKTARLKEFLDIDGDTEFKTYLDRIKEKDHVHWASQINFIKDEAGNTLLDRIWRFEDYKETFKEILSEVGAGRGPVLHCKASARNKMDFYYDTEATETVAEMYKDDIKEFGYEFPC